MYIVLTCPHVFSEHVHYCQTNQFNTRNRVAPSQVEPVPWAIQPHRQHMICCVNAQLARTELADQALNILGPAQRAEESLNSRRQLLLTIWNMRSTGRRSIHRKSCHVSSHHFSAPASHILDILRPTDTFGANGTLPILCMSGRKIKFNTLHVLNPDRLDSLKDTS